MRAMTDVLWLALAGVMTMAVAMVAASGQTPPDDAALIRAARADSNQAIARHDVPAIAKHWMPTVSIVTSTGAHDHTDDANAGRMGAQFTRRPDTVYVRTPSTIDVFAAWNVASERGEWTGRWTEPDGVVQIAGTYLAQWRKINGVWMIQAEVFAPTRCTGSKYCATHPSDLSALTELNGHVQTLHAGIRHERTARTARSCQNPDRAQGLQST